jgi:hypothetical protein
MGKCGPKPHSEETEEVAKSVTYHENTDERLCTDATFDFREESCAKKDIIG